MNKKAKKIIIPLLYIIIPLAALIGLGASSYLWYKALTPDAKKIPTIIRLSQVSPHAFSAGLEGNVRIALKEFGIGEKEIKISNADPVQDEINRIYTVKIPENASLTLFNLRLTNMAREMGGDVIRGIEGSEGKTLTLTLGVGEKPTDIVILKKVKVIITPTAKIAIVIDDLGIKNIGLAHRLCNLEQIVTLSVLPFQRYTSQVVDLAEETNTPYILHMPMEPKSSNANPGKGALYTGDDELTINKKLLKAFKSVRGAAGLNNHMGSKVTEDIRTMEYVMQFLHKNNYFFLDSRTSLQSKGYSISQRSGVKGAMISGYIDVKDDREYIKKRLDTLVQGAFENGSAIILGHDRPNTIDVLEKSLPEFEQKGIKFVRLTEVMH